MEPIEEFQGHNLLRRIVGERMSTCELRNYDVGADRYTPMRKQCLGTVEEYCRQLQRLQYPPNLVISGPCGTGKDHLACAVIRVALGYGIDCSYIRGSSLCGEMLKNVRAGDGRDIVPLRYAQVPLLVVSDVEPRTSEPTEFEERSLLELFDCRYLQSRTTVVTSNAKNVNDLRRLIGTRAADRLIDGAVVVKTNWPSYRGPER